MRTQNDARALVLLASVMLGVACGEADSDAKLPGLQTTGGAEPGGAGGSSGMNGGSGGGGSGGGGGTPIAPPPSGADASVMMDAATEIDGSADATVPEPDAGSGEASPFRFRTALDLNTYKKSFGTDVATFGKFRSDFLYTITVNGDLTDDDYRTALDVLSPTGWIVSEDNPDKADSYNRVMSALGKVDDSLCYNETGATPGGTLLTSTQLSNNAATHGGTVAVLTRDYSTRWPQWRQETDRCLDDPKVTAMVFETANPYSDQDAASLVKAVLAKGKRQYFLMPGYKTAFTLRSLNYLINEAPEAMRDERVHIVIYNYSQPDAWFGEWDTQQGTLNAIYDIAHGAGSATFYAEGSFGGRSITLGSGRYTAEQLEAIGLASDGARSIRVYSGSKVTIYQDDNFAGASTALVESVDTWTDVVSSLTIERL